MPARTADIVLTKRGPNGRPLAEIFVDDGVGAKDIQAAQNLVWGKLMKKVGLKICENCRSGLDLHIRDRLQDIVRVDLQSGAIR